MTATPLPASTVVLLRDAPGGLETFMVRRPDTSSFLPGAQVFPGGRVDPGDADAGWADAATLPAGPDALRAGRDPIARAASVAAVRELFEEAGVLLARPAGHRAGEARGALLGAESAPALAVARRAVHGGNAALLDTCRHHGWRLALDTLLPLCRWVTPPLEARRFDTRFFLAIAPPGQQAEADGVESTSGAWVRPADALASHVAGRLVLWPPTRRTIEELAPWTTVADALDWVRGVPVRVLAPRLHIEAGRRCLLLPGDPLAPVALEQDAYPSPTRFVEVEGRWEPEGERGG